MLCITTSKKNPCVDKYGKLMAVTKKLTITGANEFNQNKVHFFHESQVTLD